MTTTLAADFLRCIRRRKAVCADLVEQTAAFKRAQICTGFHAADPAMLISAARIEAERLTAVIIAASAALAAEAATSRNALATKAMAVLALQGGLEDHIPLIRSLAADLLRYLGQPVPEADPIEREAEVLDVAAEVAALGERAAANHDGLRRSTSEALLEARELNALLRRRTAALAAIPASTSFGVAAKARAALAVDLAAADPLGFAALARSVMREMAAVRRAVAAGTAPA